jgi:hypothetical protein
MTMVEIMGLGQQPFGAQEHEEVKKFILGGGLPDVARFVPGTDGPSEFGYHHTGELVQCMKRCWAHTAAERPEFQDILGVVSKVMPECDGCAKCAPTASSPAILPTPMMQKLAAYAATPAHVGESLKTESRYNLV